jgi:DNA helicase HerA-like ATPase
LEVYPSQFLADPSQEASGIAEFVGMDVEDYGLLKTAARVVGYFDGEMGEFINPLTLPMGGVRVYLADDEVLGWISKARVGEPGSADIGTVFGRDTRVVLSVRDLVSRHLSVIAATGAGKSYALGVILEERMGPLNRASVLVLDPHGEYHSLSEMQNMPEFSADGYRPRVRIITPDRIKVRIKDLRLGELISVIDDGTLSPKMKTLFESVYNAVKRDDNRHLVAGELRNEIRNRIDSDIGDFDSSTYHALLWRMSVLDNPIFSDFEHMDLSEYFNVGQLTVLDLSGIGERFQQLVAAILLRRVFDARRGTVTGAYSEESGERYIPYPVFVVLEEAHRFAPQGGEAKSKSELKTILSEGRKFGVGVCLISQRPSKLDQDALSQCMSQVTMRIINPVDQSQVAAAMESMSRDLLSELPALSKGQAVVSGMAVNTPCTVQIRRRLTRHGGADIDAPEQWRRAWTGGPARRGSLSDYDDDVDVGV